MKTMYITLAALLLGGNTLLAQPGHIKQPPKIPNVSNNVTKVNARIHANSNSIYGATKTRVTDKKVNDKKQNVSTQTNTATIAEDKKSKQKKQKSNKG